jgi:hypothetical protein
LKTKLGGYFVNIKIKNSVLPIARKSFALIEKFRITYAFAFDDDFERLGYTVL